jgi:competence protein ComEC
MTPDSLDLRLAPAALAAWLTAAVAVGWPPSVAVLTSAALLAAGFWSAKSGTLHSAVIALILAAGAALAVGSLRGGAVSIGPVPQLADDRAQVSLTARVASDPIERPGQFVPFVIVRLTVRQVTGRGTTTDVATPVLAIADESWSGLRLGQTIRASGRFGDAATPDVAAVLYGDENPVVLSESSWMWRGAGAVRDGVREAVARAPPDERALVPALVDGEESPALETLSADFQASGMTHLLAVSGSNLTLVLSFTLLVARLVGVRAHGLTVVAVAAVVFFVLVARPEPSVLRAAAMGVVGLAGLAAGGRRRGSRALCIAVLVLVLVDPWLARSPGFTLSTLATAGILLFGRPWRDALAAWMPVSLAEAIAVPLAAQLACTPAVAVLSGTVSMVAIAANVAAAPAVGPATVLGLVGGLIALVSDGAAHLVGTLAALPAWWIVWVAHTAAGTRGASVGWPGGVVGIVALTAVCIVAAVAMRALLARPPACLALAALTLLVVVQPWGRIGWPPRDWVMAMCDVGQGDALALRVADGAAVVVDAGPDPALVDRCLDDLGIRTVPLVVLTHFHADHVDGLPGVLDGRRVGQIEVSPLAEPADRAGQVARWAAEAHVPITTAQLGESWRIGEIGWTTLGPTDSTLRGGDDESGEGDGSAPNNASVVMRVETPGFTIMLTGDAEPEEEDAILDAGSDLSAEVIKVSHHGSSNQDPDFYASTGAAIALISVGADNDYGHPSPETIDVVESLGMRVYRTDRDGTVVLAERDGGLVVVEDD